MTTTPQEMKESFIKLWESQGNKNYNSFKELLETNIEGEKLKQELLKEYFPLESLNKWTLESHREYTKNYTSLNDFIPRGYRTEHGRPLFIFPQQSLNVITARTGHGKTQLLVNLSVDAVKQFIEKEIEFTEKGQAIETRPVVFVSLEMTQEQLAQRFINNLIYTAWNSEPYGSLPGYNRNLQTIIDKITDYSILPGVEYKPDFNKIKLLESELQHDFNIAKKEDPASVELYAKLYYGAQELINKWVNENRLYIFDIDAVDNNINNLEKFLNAIPNSIVFVDYLQYISTEQSENYLGIKDICTTLKKSSAKNNQIIITAGQFNRDFETDESTYPDELKLKKLAEGSDIEKTSYYVYGLAYYTEAGKRNYYLKIMKQREGGDTDKSYKLFTNLAYSFIRPSNDDNGNGILETARRQKPGKKGNDSGNKTTDNNKTKSTELYKDNRLNNEGWL